MPFPDHGAFENMWTWRYYWDHGTKAFVSTNFARCLAYKWSHVITEWKKLIEKKKDLTFQKGYKLIGKYPDTGKDWGKGGGGDKGWDGWMASPAQWTWIWANSGRQWGTEEPGVPQSMRSQRVRHDLATKQKNNLSSLFKKRHQKQVRGFQPLSYFSSVNTSPWRECLQTYSKFHVLCNVSPVLPWMVYFLLVFLFQETFCLLCEVAETKYPLGVS